MNKHNEKIVAIIPARGGSKSMLRKNVLPLRGKPIVAWPIELAKSIPEIDRVILTSDDDEIMTIGKKYGAEILFRRPAELCLDETPTLPVLQNAIKFLKEKENYQPDIVLLLYATAPLLKKTRVVEALALFEHTKCNSVVSVVEDYGRFWREEDGVYRPLHPKERVNRQYYRPLYREDGSIYFSRFAVLMNMNKVVDEQNIQFIIMSPDENVDIDNPVDFEKVKKLIKKI